VIFIFDDNAGAEETDANHNVSDDVQETGV